MGDALAIALLSKRGFKKEDFAFFHPGGTLGRHLLLRVSDIMHHGDAVPMVHEETPLHQVVLEMTEKKMGMTTVIRKNRTLVGVITDGDLRRLLLSGHANPTQLFALPAKAVMTTHPKKIRQEALIVEAMHLMETYAITTVVVEDDAESVIGVVHLNDIIRTKSA